MLKMNVIFFISTAGAINLATESPTAPHAANAQGKDTNFTERLIDDEPGDDYYAQMLAADDERSCFSKCFALCHPNQFQRVTNFVKEHITVLSTAHTDHDSAFQSLKELAQYMNSNEVYLTDPQGFRVDDVYGRRCLPTRQLGGTCWVHASSRALRDYIQKQFPGKMSALNLFPYQCNIQKTLVNLALGHQEGESDQCGGHLDEFLGIVGQIMGALMMIFAADADVRAIADGWLNRDGLLKLLRKKPGKTVHDNFQEFTSVYAPPYFLHEVFDDDALRNHATVFHAPASDFEYYEFDSNYPNANTICVVNNAHFTTKRSLLFAFASIDSDCDLKEYVDAAFVAYRHVPDKFYPATNQLDRDGRSKYICLLAQICSANEIQQYHDLGVDFNVSDGGDSPLMVAIGRGDLELCKKLVSFGVDLYLDEARLSSLMFAAGCFKRFPSSDERREILDLILSSCPAENIHDQLVVLSKFLPDEIPRLAQMFDICLETLSKDVISSVLDEFDPDLNLETEIDGKSLFQGFAEVAHGFPFLRMYLAAGFDINHTCSAMGRTALHYAVSNAMRVNVATLLEANADVTIRDMNDHTALDVAHQVLQAQPDNEDIKEIIQLMVE